MIKMKHLKVIGNFLDLVTYISISSGTNQQNQKKEAK
jgi:hypothetical protein